jgi:hypothetical protein
LYLFDVWSLFDDAPRAFDVLCIDVSAKRPPSILKVVEGSHEEAPKPTGWLQ